MRSDVADEDGVLEVVAGPGAVVSADAVPQSSRYRWGQVDCGCYSTQSLYARSADAYFSLRRPDASDEEFYSDNDGICSRYDEPTVRTIIEETRAEARRRAGVPDVFKRNNATIRERYRPAHPEFFPSAGAAAQAVEASGIFREEFLALHRRIADGAERPEAEAGVKAVHADCCFECPLLATEFCERFKAELRNFKSQDLPHQQPNTMNRYGCILNEIGLGPFMDWMLTHYLEPVCRALYPDLLGNGIDAHHSFTVSYEAGKDTRLGVHDDNSEVTVNVALTEDYSGAELAMYHRARVAHPQREDREAYHHRVGVGTMLLHPGELLHEVLPLTAGERIGLIMWLRSDTHRQKHGCPLCGSADSLLYAGSKA